MSDSESAVALPPFYRIPAQWDLALEEWLLAVFAWQNIGVQCQYHILFMLCGAWVDGKKELAYPAAARYSRLQIMGNRRMTQREEDEWQAGFDTAWKKVRRYGVAPAVV